MIYFFCKCKPLIIAVLLCGILQCLAGWQCDTPQPGVYILRNENGIFGGYNTRGILPIGSKQVVARKTIDLTKLPAKIVQDSKSAALQIYLNVMDDSINRQGTSNGLQDKFIISVNGHKMEFFTGDKRIPAKTDRSVKRRSEWVEFPFPVKYLYGQKILDIEITKKAFGDDFLYPGIDPTVPTTHSKVSLDGGKKWSSEWLDTGKNGEFMIRLLVTDSNIKETISKWVPGKKPEDPLKIMAGTARNDKHLRLNLNSGNINCNYPVRLTVKFSGTDPRIWLHFPGGDAAEPFAVTDNRNGVLTGILPIGRCPYAIGFDGFEKIDEIKISCIPQIRLDDNIVDMSPVISSASGRRHQNQYVRRNGKRIELDSGSLRAVFDTSHGLSLISLYAFEMKSEILKLPNQNALFLLRLPGNKVLNAKDGDIQKISMKEKGFKALLNYAKYKILAEFTVDIEDDELKLSLNLMSQKGEQKVIVAFPHLDGLVLSRQAQQDYYCFPWGGGIIADRDASLRTIYGDNEAWWQMISLFSPERGGGFYLRITDTTGITKAFSLRKARYASAEHIIRPPKVAGRNTTELLFSPTPLRPGEGIGIAVDYQRLTLNPKEFKAFPSANIGAHAGNWKYAMTRYAKWAKTVWKFRPYPGKLTGTYNLLAGIGCGRPLYKENFERLKTEPIDIAEINGYWTVSDKAPWNTPFENIERLGPRLMREYKNGFGFYPDPETGKMLYMFNRGDYDGYNPQWGGLPRLQKLIKSIQKQNKLLLLYTDPILVSANSNYGKKYAPNYAVINPAWKDPHQCLGNPTVPPGVVCNYYSYCMCLNSPEYIKHVADSMARLIKETDADGIRLDEYGHRGYVCLSNKHKHIYGEYGQHVWLQALKKSVQMIREKTDTFKPDALLLGEFPGADITAAEFDGALSYDICRRQSALRPVQVNLFRFFFPECKIFELNVAGPKNSMDYWLFNGLGVYNSGRYKREYWEILQKHKDAFSGDIEPLVPTLRKHVYANRFTTLDKKKTIYTIINHNRFAVDEPVLLLPEKENMRCYEEISKQKLILRPYLQGQAISLRLNPEEVKVVVVERS